MSTPENLKELYADELRDLWSANDQMLRALEKLAPEASDAKLKAMLDKSLAGIRKHTDSIKPLIEKAGEEVEPEHCRGMEGLAREALKHGIEEAPKKGPLRDIAIITQYQRMSHYGITGFGSVAALAEALGEKSDVKTLKGIVSDIYKSDEYATHLSETAIKAATH
jgi:ferritin-like metal-binding protein YciE